MKLIPDNIFLASSPEAKLKSTLSNLRIPSVIFKGEAFSWSEIYGCRSITSNIRAPHVEARANEFTSIPICRTGI